MSIRYFATDDERLLVRENNDNAFERFSYETLDWVCDGLLAGLFIGEIFVDEISEKKAEEIMARIRGGRQ